MPLSVITISTISAVSRHDRNTGSAFGIEFPKIKILETRKKSQGRISSCANAAHPGG